MSDSNSSNDIGVDVSTPEDQMHDISYREQVRLARLLCSAFAKDIIEVSVEKMLSQTEAEVHISIID